MEVSIGTIALVESVRLTSYLICFTFSTFVGIAAMILSLPLPGFITARLQGTQREKMERVSADSARFARHSHPLID